MAYGRRGSICFDGQSLGCRYQFLGLVGEQCQYNLLHRLPEVELIPTAKDLGIGILPWSPLAGGMLSGNYKKGQRRGPVMRDAERPVPEAQLAAYEKLCADLGEKPADVAIAWTLANPAVTSTIIGPSSIDQFEKTLHAIEIDLPEDFLKELDKIFPGYEEGPMAYAW